MRISDWSSDVCSSDLGHPTSAAVALKNIEIIEREDLVRRTREDTGPYLAAKMTELSAHPMVGEARSLGFIGAVEMVSEKGTNARFGGKEGKIGRAHVCTPVTHAQLVCRLLLGKKKPLNSSH